MLRNLVSNALKYTKHGKVLLGCRRHAGVLTIEVCENRRELLPVRALKNGIWLNDIRIAPCRNDLGIRKLRFP
jgi:hypothetical protein